jgi:hypothetical protein
MFSTLIKSLQNSSVPWIVLFWLFNSFATSGQVQQLARFELPLNQGEENFNVVSAQQSGLIIYRNVFTNEGIQLELIRLDSAMKQVWKGYIPIDRTLVILQTKVSGNQLYILFKSRNYISGDFLILDVQLNSGKYLSYLVKNLIPFSPTQFNLTADAALIGGYFNYRPVIVYYNFEQKQSKVLPGLFNEPGEINQMRANQDGSFDIIVSGKNSEKKNCLWLRNYDNQGSLIKTIVLTPQDKRGLTFGSSLHTSAEEQVVSGVYGKHPGYSRGLFVAVVNGIGEYTIRYYNFSELQRFFNYMKAGKERRVKNRIERRKIKGKKSKFNYRFIMHELIPYNDQFVLVGEAFYPHYSYASNSFRALNYNPRILGGAMYRDGLVFDGYQYTHAVVIGFDKAGKLVWDNSFEINDVKSMQLEQFVKIQPEDNRIVLLYLFENALRSKIIKNSDVLEGKTIDNLSQEQVISKRKSRVKDIDNTKLDHWYNQYFFAYGNQVAGLDRGLAEAKQKVFFINKITYK